MPPHHTPVEPSPSKRPRPLFEIIARVYGPAVFVLWAVLAGLVLRFIPPMLSLGAQLTAAVTRASLALERVAVDSNGAREACLRSETKLDALRVQLAEHDARVKGKP